MNTSLAVEIGRHLVHVAPDFRFVCRPPASKTPTTCHWPFRTPGVADIGVRETSANRAADHDFALPGFETSGLRRVSQLGRISSPSGIMPRTVTFASPVPSLRGSTITTTSSPDAMGSPWLSFAMPGRVLSVGNSDASKPPESSASDPLRKTSTFSGSPLLTKAR